MPDYFTAKTDLKAIEDSRKIMLAAGVLGKTMGVGSMIWDEARN